MIYEKAGELMSSQTKFILIRKFEHVLIDSHLGLKVLFTINELHF